MLNLQLLNPNRIQIVTFLPYNMQTIEHQLLTKTQHELAYDVAYEGCFQWFKDTKMKANHNVCACLCVYLFSKDSES